MARDPYRLTSTRISGVIERVFAELTPLHRGLRDWWIDSRADDRQPVAANLSILRPLMDAVIGSDGSVVGAGVVIAPGLLSDSERCLDWRQLGPDERPRALILDVDPASEDPYDYTDMEWFRVPRDSDRRMAGGPYFDFRGAGRFTMTFAVPVRIDGTFIGVAGADVPLTALESELLPLLLALDTPSSLVSHEDRVVVSSDPRWATGQRRGSTQDEVVSMVVPDLSWRLITDGSARVMPAEL